MKRTYCFLALCALLSLQRIYAQVAPVCLPLISAPSIDGLVATDPFHLVSGTVPNSDVGWATTPYQQLAVVTGASGGTLKAAIFAGSTLSGGKPNHLYMGVHVENAEEFSSQDVVTIYVDSNGDGTPDFALSYNIGPSTPASGVSSNKVPTSGTLTPFSGGAWGTPQSLIPEPGTPNVKSRTAWNFSGGSGNGIWELEIDMNLAALGFSTSSSGLSFGAKLYVANPNSAIPPIPFDWPSGLTTDLNPNDSGPGAGSGTDPATLDKRTINGDGQPCSGDVLLPTDSLRSHARGTDDLFYLPKATDFDGSGNLPSQFQTQLIANPVYQNTGDTGNTSPTGGTNTGNVHFYLMPWGAGAVENVDAGIAPIGFQQFGTPVQATVSWPSTKAQWDAHSNSFLNLSNHVCLRVVLESFLQDSVTSNDSPPQINLTYTAMSTHRDKFLIHAPGTFTPGAPKQDYLLKVNWANLDKGMVKDPSKKECWFLRWLESLFPKKHWEAKFINSPGLELKPRGNGYYGFKLAPGEEVTADVELSGTVMPVPSQAIHVSPGAGGQVLSPASGDPAVVVPVIAGGIVTVVANGQIGFNANATTFSLAHNPNGFDNPKLAGETFLLSSKASTPSQIVNALIGSFKADFSDSFFIGTESTFFVPPGNTRLYLAVNSTAGQYAANAGPGFELNVVATPPTTLPTKLSWPANPKLGLPGTPQPAVNLPTVAIDIIRVDQANKATIPIGYVAYATYATHDGNKKQVATVKP